MLQLVTEGMKMCPPKPNFIQARDAFFEAVEVSNYRADNWGDLWEAFRKRGMGGGSNRFTGGGIVCRRADQSLSN